MSLSHLTNFSSLYFQLPYFWQSLTLLAFINLFKSGIWILILYNLCKLINKLSQGLCSLPTMKCKELEYSPSINFSTMGKKWQVPRKYHLYLSSIRWSTCSNQNIPNLCTIAMPKLLSSSASRGLKVSFMKKWRGWPNCSNVPRQISTKEWRRWYQLCSKYWTWIV